MRTGGWIAERRVLALAGSAVLHLAALALLLSWPAPRPDRQLRDALTTIAFPSPSPTPEPSPPPTVVEQRKLAETSGTQGALATPVPTLAAALPLALPSVAPSVPPSDGDDSRTGGGSTGVGPGAGGTGAGAGGRPGSDRPHRDGSPPLRIRGEVKDSDYPRKASEAGEHGRVETEIKVDRKGRPSACAVTRSSGSVELDQATCRLIMRRFRYSPARDRSGSAVAGTATYALEWIYRQADGV